MIKSDNNQTKDISRNDVSRRDFLKFSGIAGVAALVPAGTALADDKNSLEDKTLGMVIDLQKCTGCGGCVISCINENNVQTGTTWAKIISKTVGKFPNVGLDVKPTLCNHCEKAPCIRTCPTGAMHKEDGGITAHNPKICIGCRKCIEKCPYDVITYNATETHKFWRDKKTAIKGCTSSGKEITQKVKGNTLPYYNKDKETTFPGAALRRKGVVEKCTFCDHRVPEGKLPFCVNSCPPKARIFGDLDDPNSEVSKLIKKYPTTRLKEHLGTEPKIFYIRSFNSGNNKATKGKV